MLIEQTVIVKVRLNVLVKTYITAIGISLSLDRAFSRLFCLLPSFLSVLFTPITNVC